MESPLARGETIHDQYMKQIKKNFMLKDKKQKHRTIWFIRCKELNIPYSTLEADLQFENNCMAKSSKNNNDNEIDVPITVTVGVTLSLCGLFLMFVPLPVCNNAGFWLLDTGVGILASEAIQKWDDYDKEKQKE